MPRPLLLPHMGEPLPRVALGQQFGSCNRNNSKTVNGMNTTCTLVPHEQHLRTHLYQ